MKKFSLLIAISLFFQSFAWAAPKESLKTLLTEYHYALTVEWDKKNEEDFKKIKSSFSHQLKELLLEEGLTMRELREVIEENKRELKISDGILAFFQTSEGLDAERAQDFLSENSHLLYQEGASWAPAGQLALWGIGALLVFEIIVLIATTPEDLCPHPDYHPNDVPYTCQY